jgi:hypothetical protein
MNKKHQILSNQQLKILTKVSEPKVINYQDTSNLYENPIPLYNTAPKEDVDWTKPKKLKKRRVYQLGVDIPSDK